MPAPGGISYTNEDEFGTIFGFDCGHAWDRDDSQKKDIGWLQNACEGMAYCLIEAGYYEARFEQAMNNEIRAMILEEYHEACARYGQQFDLTENFGSGRCSTCCLEGCRDV